MCALLAALLQCAAAAAVPTFDRFEMLRQQDLRVARVAYRLAIANASRCGAVATAQPGFVLHGLGQYAPPDREAAAQRFALDRHVGVMAVVVGSPAAQAGLMAGDQVLAVDGRGIDLPSAVGPPDRNAVDSVRSTLVAALQHGPITLTVSSAKGVRDLRFAAALGCPSDVELVTGADINAWADGSRVIIGDGLLLRCATDDDLALVIGHEMAHNLLHHRRRLAADGVVVNGLLPLSTTSSRSVLVTEEEADRLAVALATAAGFDMSGAPDFIGTLMSAGVPVTTHPDLVRRVTLLRAAIADPRRASAAIVSDRASPRWQCQLPMMAFGAQKQPQAPWFRARCRRCRPCL